MSKELHHLFKAIQDNRLEQVKVAVRDNQSLVNAKDDKGITPLIIASECGNTDVVNTLIKHGAHINYQIPEKLHTPLMIAAQKGQLDTVKYLLQSGADTTITDAGGKTALWYAQQKKNQHIIDLLQKI